MWYGYAGKVLKVNLTDSKVEVESLDREAAQNFMGGSGLGAKYLYDEVDPSVDALSPDNVLIFVTGPLTGTGAPSAGRYMVMRSAERVIAAGLLSLAVSAAMGDERSVFPKYAIKAGKLGPVVTRRRSDRHTHRVEERRRARHEGRGEERRDREGDCH